MGHKIQNTLFIQLREITMSTHIKLITNKQKQLNHHHHNVQNYTVSINIKIDVHARSIKFFFYKHIHEICSDIQKGKYSCTTAQSYNIKKERKQRRKMEKW